ncbi:uncharacterized protein LOC135324870 [Dromaius novaehollandiae]|uniref:uncharacterized protein LOC135324870 n=1 Tax=Dromaius novaehollandiae TaxID=8790 RepID=UPI00311DE8A8
MGIDSLTREKNWRRLGRGCSGAELVPGKWACWGPSLPCAEALLCALATQQEEKQELQDTALELRSDNVALSQRCCSSRQQLQGLQELLPQLEEKQRSAQLQEQLREQEERAKGSPGALCCSGSASGCQRRYRGGHGGSEQHVVGRETPLPAGGQGYVATGAPVAMEVCAGPSQPCCLQQAADGAGAPGGGVCVARAAGSPAGKGERQRQGQSRTARWWHLAGERASTQPHAAAHMCPLSVALQEREELAKRCGLTTWLKRLCVLFVCLELLVICVLGAVVLYASQCERELLYRLLLWLLPEQSYARLAYLLAESLAVCSEGLLPF